MVRKPHTRENEPCKERTRKFFSNLLDNEFGRLDLAEYWCLALDIHCRPFHRGNASLFLCNKLDNELRYLTRTRNYMAFHSFLIGINSYLQEHNTHNNMKHIFIPLKDMFRLVDVCRLSLLEKEFSQFLFKF